MLHFFHTPRHSIINYSTIILKKNDFHGNGKKVLELTKNGKLQDAFESFMQHPDPAGALALIPRQNQINRVDMLFNSLCQKSFLNTRVITAYVNTCRKLKNAKQSLSAWKLIEDNAIQLDEFLFNSLVAASIEANDDQFTTKLFTIWRTVSTTKNVINTGILFIKGFAAHGNLDNSFKAYDFICQDTKPTDLVFNNLIMACRNCNEPSRVVIIRNEMQKHSIALTEYLLNSFLAAYTDDVTLLRCLLDEWSSMKQLKEPDNTCIQFIQAFSKHEHHGTAFKAYRILLRHMRPTVPVLGALSYALRYCDRPDYIQAIWKDVKTYSLTPHETMLNSLLTACAYTASSSLGKEIHRFIIDRSLEQNIMLRTSLINMYGKCGLLTEAVQLFNDTLESTELWNAMLSVYSVHGRGKEALNLYQEFSRRKLKADKFTITSVLNACSHSGLVDDALKLFNSSVDIVEPTIEMYNCLVDALSRTNRLADAEKIIKSMRVSPDMITWTAYLGGCRKFKDIQRAEVATKELQKLGPAEASTYVLMSNIYAESGEIDKSKHVWQSMKERGIKKSPGISMIEINGQMHVFRVGDTSHPLYDKIDERLNIEFEKMREVGFVHDTTYVSHVHETESEKIHHLCKHSEKLALAYGLISTPEGTPLMITKNLRVCPDCHTATKYIAMLNNRVITVRDRNRFHVMKDGKCSCEDFW
jgi:pentatricopeptide repeat protein